MNGGPAKATAKDNKAIHFGQLWVLIVISCPNMKKKTVDLIKGIIILRLGQNDFRSAR
jgi:hypothetical protein